jgi:hypothetical protein
MDAFARVLAAPASLDARRQLAAEWDAAGDPRGAVVRAQLEAWELARRGQLGTPRWYEVRKQANDLINANRKTWAGAVATLVDDFAFHRGLIARVTLSVDDFVERAKELVSLAPIQHLDLHRPATRWDELVALPQLDQIVSFEIARAASEVGDAQAIALARSRHAAGLRWIGLAENAIGRAGVEALAASPYLKEVVFLSLRGNDFDPTPRVWDDNGVAFTEPNRYGEELQRTYGPRPWLAGPGPERGSYWPPDRDEYAAR